MALEPRIGIGIRALSRNMQQIPLMRMRFTSSKGHQQIQANVQVFLSRRDIDALLFSLGPSRHCKQSSSVLNMPRTIKKTDTLIADEATKIHPEDDPCPLIMWEFMWASGLNSQDTHPATAIPGCWNPCTCLTLCRWPPKKGRG